MSYSCISHRFFCPSFLTLHFHRTPRDFKQERDETSIFRERLSIRETAQDRYLACSADLEKIGSFEELEAVSEGSAWQHFERLAAFIFEQNGFAVSLGMVKTRKKARRQYDVVAKKDGLTLLVECKRWSGGRYRLSALRRAVAQHRERAQFWEEVTGGEAVPVIVMLIEEEIRIFEGVPLVPVTRLNAFISELDRYADDCSFAEFEVLDVPVEEEVPEEGREYPEAGEEGR